MSKKAYLHSLYFGNPKFLLLEAFTIHIMGLRPKPNAFYTPPDQSQPQKNINFHGLPFFLPMIPPVGTGAFQREKTF